MSPILVTPSVLGSPKRPYYLDPGLRICPRSNTPASLSTTSDSDAVQQLAAVNMALEILSEKKANAENIYEKELYLDEENNLLAEKRELMKSLAIDDGGSQGDGDEEEEGEDKEDLGLEQAQEDSPTKKAKTAKTAKGSGRQITFIRDVRAREDAFRKGREGLKKSLEKLGIRTGCYGMLYINRFNHLQR